MRLRIQRFDPAKQVKQHRVIIIIGRRGTGKSILLKDLCYHLRDRWDFGIACTPTEETAETFRSMMPDSWVFDGFDMNRLEQMMLMQRANQTRGKERSLFLLTDDCGFDRGSFRGKAVRDLMMNGRHYHICYMSCLQYCLDMTPDIRSQIDYVFCLKDNILSNRQRLWRAFFGMFERYEDFSRTLDRCTDNYACLVLDQTTPTSKIEDCVFWYRGGCNIPKFTIGKPVFHRLAARHAMTAKERRHATEVRLQAKTVTDKRVTEVERTDRRGRVIREQQEDSVLIT